MLRRRAGSAKGPSPSGRAIARMAASQPASRRFAGCMAGSESVDAPGLYWYRELRVHTLGVKGRSIYWDVSSIKRSLARKTFSSAPKPRPSENSNPIAPHTRFHASARARPGFPCAPRNAPRRKGGPAEMAMARWPMAALLASVAPIGRHQSDVRGMPPAWNRSAAADLMVGGWS